MSLYCIVFFGGGGGWRGVGWLRIFFYLSVISFLSVLFFWNKVNNYAWKQVNKTKIVKVKLFYTTIFYTLLVFMSINYNLF